MKAVIQSLPKEAGLDLVALEYELQLLKILSVGWSLSYLLEESPLKEGLVQAYWNIIRDFSHNVSQMSATTMSQDFNYFAVIKERLDSYVACLDGGAASGGGDPTALIGPKFAEHCQMAGNVFAVMAGSKLFNLSVNAVKEYLESIQLDDGAPVTGSC